MRRVAWKGHPTDPFNPKHLTPNLAQQNGKPWPMVARVGHIVDAVDQWLERDFGVELPMDLTQLVIRLTFTATRAFLEQGKPVDLVQFLRLSTHERPEYYAISNQYRQAYLAPRRVVPRVRATPQWEESMGVRRFGSDPKFKVEAQRRAAAFVESLPSGAFEVRTSLLDRVNLLIGHFNLALAESGRTDVTLVDDSTDNATHAPPEGWVSRVFTELKAEWDLRQREAVQHWDTLDQLYTELCTADLTDPDVQVAMRAEYRRVGQVRRAALDRLFYLTKVLQREQQRLLKLHHKFGRTDFTLNAPTHAYDGTDLPSRDLYRKLPRPSKRPDFTYHLARHAESVGSRPAGDGGESGS